MNRFFIFVLLFTISNLLAHSQGINESDIIVVQLERVAGIGPSGNHSYGIASKDILPTDELKAYPRVKNLPDLENLLEYCYVIDNRQFFYQSFCQGIYDYEQFSKEMSRHGYTVEDTVGLSKIPLKTTISVAAGFDKEGKAVYVVDVNNNNDFADDDVKHLPSSMFLQESEILASSQYVQIERFNSGMIVKDSILLLLKSSPGSSSSNKLSLMFQFPEFTYGRFSHKGKNYIICADIIARIPSIYLLDDRPYFGGIDRGKQVKLDQYVQVGNDYYQFVRHSPAKDQIILIKVGGSVTVNQSPGTNSLLVSDQVGLIAPNIEGKAVEGGSLVSLKSLKGKYVYLDFWSTSCGPCIAEFPALMKIHEEYAGKQFAIVGIVDDRTNGKLKQFMDKHNLAWPNIDLNAPSTKNEGYQINQSYPTTYLIDPQGKVIAYNIRSDELKTRLELLKVKKK